MKLYDPFSAVLHPVKQFIKEEVSLVNCLNNRNTRKVLKRIITIIVLFMMVAQATVIFYSNDERCYLTQELGKKKAVENEEDHKELKKAVYCHHSVQIFVPGKINYCSANVTILATPVCRLLSPPPDLDNIS